MKRAVILHGTGNTPADNWFPWLKRTLEEFDYEVFVPQLPEAQAPNRHKYEDFLLESGWDFSDNVIIGHSSGSTTLLNLLSQAWFPNLKAAVFVGFFVNNDYIENNPPEWYTPGQFEDLFPPDGFDFNLIKSKIGNSYVIHGDDDPYCDPKLASQTALLLNAKLKIIKGGKHLSKNSGGYTKLPEIIELLKEDSIL